MKMLDMLTRQCVQGFSELRQVVVPDPMMLFLSGPSACGKDQLIKAAMAARPKLVKSVSATTRRPRLDKGRMEVDGKDYHFLSVRDFLRRIEQGGFLEHAMVHENHYGTPWSSIEEAWARGESIIGDINIDGVDKLRSLEDSRVHDRLVTVFVSAPSIQRMQRQMRARTDGISPAEEQTRIETAHSEIPQAGRYDHVIINDKFDAALAELLEFIDMLMIQMDLDQRCERFLDLSHRRGQAIDFLRTKFDWAVAPIWAAEGKCDLPA